MYACIVEASVDLQQMQVRVVSGRGEQGARLRIQMNREEENKQSLRTRENNDGSLRREEQLHRAADDEESSELRLLPELRAAATCLLPRHLQSNSLRTSRSSTHAEHDEHGRGGERVGEGAVTLTHPHHKSMLQANP